MTGKTRQIAELKRKLALYQCAVNQIDDRFEYSGLDKHSRAFLDGVLAQLTQSLALPHPAYSKEVTA